MSRLEARDVATVAVFVIGGGAVAALALAGRMDWALAALGVLLALVGIVARVEFASRRSSHRSAEETAARARQLADTVSAARLEIADARSDIAIVRDDLAATRTEADEAMSATRREMIISAQEARQEAANMQSGVTRLVRMVHGLGPDLMTDMQALMQLFTRYPPSAPLPIIAGWALSPAGLLFLTDSIETRGAEFVVECGSGTSTLWMALAMRHKGSGKVLALEHLEEYAEKTRAVLDAHGLSEWAEVRVCPLVDVSTPRGEYPWYDLDLDSIPRKIDILLVDGPPGSTGNHARYPALPRLRPVLAEQCLVVADDTDRRDEREVLAFWKEEWPELTQLGSPGRGVNVFAGGPTVEQLE